MCGQGNNSFPPLNIHDVFDDEAIKVTHSKTNKIKNRTF
jgi:hypothetical protein